MSPSWILVVLLLAPLAASSRLQQRLAGELDAFKALMLDGAPALHISVLDPLREDEIPIHSSASIFKADGSLKDLLVSGLSSFTYKLTALSDNKVSIEIDIPSASASMTYDLKGALKLGFVRVPLSGSSLVTAKVDGIRASADLDVTINADNSLTLENISNVAYSYSKSNVKVAAMNGIINKLLNKLIPSILKSNRSKIDKAIREEGKENINKYFDLIAGKTSKTMLVRSLAPQLTVGDEITISPESRAILVQIVNALARSH